MVKFFRRSSAKIGIPAGTPIYIGDTAPLATQVDLVQFAKEQQLQPIPLDFNQIEKQILDLKHKGGWIHVAGLANIQVIDTICQMLDIEALSIEDILNTDQLSKIECFQKYTLIVTRMPIIVDCLQATKLDQISFILKENLLVTFQENHTPFIDQITKHINHLITKPLNFDSEYLLYLILDMIIDEHFAIVEQKGDALESLEERIIQQNEDIQLNTLYLLKRDMLHLRKNIMSLNNIVNLLIHEHKIILSQLPSIYLRDLQDHVLRIIESIDIHRELSKNILDIYLSTVNTRINETMRLLAVYAAIFIPLTFITSFYGMNFQSIPELTWKYGYFFAIGLMLSVTGGLLFYFRKKKWI